MATTNESDSLQGLLSKNTVKTLKKEWKTKSNL